MLLRKINKLFKIANRVNLKLDKIDIYLTQVKKLMGGGISIFAKTNNPDMSRISQILIALLSALLMASCSPKVTVMSFNVRQSKAKEVDPNNSWKNRKEACLTMLKETMPDVVGFQEVQMGDQWPFFRDGMQATHDGYAIGRRDGKVKGETSGFLYNREKLTLLEHGTFWLSETPGKPSLSFDEKYYRSATWGVFKVAKSNKHFLYVNTHMGLTYKSQVEGFKVILDKLPELNPHGYPVVITGDFNVPVNHDAFAQARETMNNALDVAKQKVNAVVPTYNAWGNERKQVIIDHIWLSKDIKCLVYVTDNKSYGGHTYISDHYPVIAELRF